MSANITPPQPSVPVSEEIDLKAWFFRVVRLWPWFLFLTAASLFIAWIMIKTTQPVYQSSAIIMLKDDKKSGSGNVDNSVMRALNMSGPGKQIENEIEVLKSFDLIREVVLDEQLYVTVKKRQVFADRVLYGDEQPFRIEVSNPTQIKRHIIWILKPKKQGWQVEFTPGNKGYISLGVWYQWSGIRFRILPPASQRRENLTSGTEDAEYSIVLNSVESATIGYKAIDVKQTSRSSSVLSITVNDAHYGRGNAFLRSLIKIYNKQGLEDKNLTTSNTIEFLDDRLALLEGDLRNVEGSVEGFKRANNLTDISSQANTYLTLVSEIDRQKAEQETRLNLVNALERELLDNRESPRLVPNTLGVTDLSAANLIEQHNQLILQRERMASVAGPKNPALVELDNQVRELRLNLLENVRNLRGGYVLSLNDLKAQDRKMNQRLKAVPSLERQFLEISRDRNVKQQIYLFLLQKREESAIALASSVIDSRTVEAPRAIRRVKPRARLMYGSALAIGLTLALIPLLLIDFLDNKVGSAREVIDRSRLPFLGELSHVKNLQNPIVISSQKRDAVSEQIRAIRTNISFTSKGSEVKKILFTSQIPGEGKSFTSLNIAMSYALLGKKVALMEFDLRKPRLLKNLGLQANKGISHYLAGQAELSDIIIRSPGENQNNLDIIPSGAIPPNPSELILGDKMTTLIRELEENYDFVFIDSPPFSLVTDAILLKAYADISIVVMRQGYSSKTIYRDLHEKFRFNSEDPVYVLLNGVNRFTRYSYYGSKYLDYGYGYGYGYGGYGKDKSEYYSDK
jgi:tyrosine-protein kinase Etk/Wzc